MQFSTDENRHDTTKTCKVSVKTDKKTDKLFIGDTPEDIEIPVEEAPQIEN